MDIVDFYVMLATGQILHKSKMAPGIWREFYPAGAMTINCFNYRLISEDVIDLYVRGTHGDVRIRQRQEWGRYRLFCHHNGRAMLAQGDEAGVGEHIGTTFGVIYLDRKVIHKFMFTPDGEFMMDVEAFDVIEPVM